MGTALAPHRAESDLRIGAGSIVKAAIGAELGPGRVLAPLSVARTIQEPGFYWISAEGMPKEAGYYFDDSGVFVRVTKRTSVAWRNRVFISEDAVERAAKGEGPVALYVDGKDYYLGRLHVLTLDKEEYVATTASVMRSAPGAREAVRGCDS
jgi:hypothetical protein